MLMNSMSGVGEVRAVRNSGHCGYVCMDMLMVDELIKEGYEVVLGEQLRVNELCGEQSHEKYNECIQSKTCL
jgi:alanine racemase